MKLASAAITSAISGIESVDQHQYIIKKENESYAGEKNINAS